MRSLLVVLVVGVPALALAQPAPPPPPPAGDPAPPPPAPGPYDPNAPGPYAAPPPAGPPPGQPQPYGAPQPYGPAPAPYQPYQPPPPEQPHLRSGMTFEVNLGPGWLRASPDEGASDTSDMGAGFSLGLGGWVGPKVAITGRIITTTVFDSQGGYDTQITSAIIAGSAQYWIDDHFWLGGGLGFATYKYSVEGDGIDVNGDIDGFGFDLRAGYTFTQGTENSWNASLELTPAFYSQDDYDTGGTDATITGISLLVGYQHL